jgi:hypothetical protein
MTAKNREDILGLEFDWLASDADGHVGFFSTAGGGWVPKEFLEDTEVHDRAIELITRAAPSTQARFAPQVAPGLQNTWQLMAERGVFAFDSDSDGGPYRLVAAPALPISVAQLPTPANAIAQRLVFRNLRFSEQVELSATFLLNSRDGS